MYKAHNHNLLLSTLEKREGLGCMQKLAIVSDHSKSNYIRCLCMCVCMYRVILCLLLLIFTTRPCYCMQDCAHCCSLLLSCMHNVMNVYKFLPFPLFCLSLSLTHTHIL